MNRSVTALIVAVLMVVSTVVGGQALSFGKYEKVKAENGTVSIALSKVSNGKAHFFKFADNGKEIAFLWSKLRTAVCGLLLTPAMPAIGTKRGMSSKETR